MLGDSGQNATEIFFLQAVKFSRDQGIRSTSRVAAGLCQWTHNWIGVHPRFASYSHSIQVSEYFEPELVCSTHQIIVTCAPINGGKERLLYKAELDLSNFLQLNQPDLAKVILIDLVTFLLRSSKPQDEPGLVQGQAAAGTNPWGCAVREILENTANTLSPS